MSRRVESSKDQEVWVIPNDVTKQGEYIADLDKDDDVPTLTLLLLVLSGAAPTTIEDITLVSDTNSIKKQLILKLAPQEVQPSISKDKGKGIMIEPKVPLKRKDQIAFDEQIARDIQAKLDAELLEEQKLAREQEEEANIALIEMEADRLLAGRLQSKEREGVDK
ncbi:hypothetical protein Tco_1128836 [Tanacetum coccineum]